jgi:NaMN:DMB phosphoribosyltransferase
VTKKSRLMPMLIAGTVLAASAYALSRAATKVRQVRVAAQHDAPPSGPRADLRKRAQPPDPLTLDLSDLFNAPEIEA